MKTVRLLDTSGKNEIDAIVTDRNIITKQSKGNRKYSYKDCHNYYLKNREKLLDYRHRHYMDNREKILEQRREHNALPAIKVQRARYARQYYERTKNRRN